MRAFTTDRKAAICCLVCLVLLLAAGTVTAAESMNTGAVREKLLIIDTKTEHAVIVGERKFMVTAETRIYDTRGSQIPLIDLAVPCEAMVQYRLIMDKSPVVLRVQVKKLLPGASVSPLFHLREK